MVMSLLLALGCAAAPTPGLAQSDEAAPAEVEASEVEAADSAADETAARGDDETLPDTPDDDLSAEPDTALTEPDIAPLVPPEPPAWPGLAPLVEALADQSRRRDTLLTLAALLTLHDLPRSSNPEEGQERATALLGQRDWLVRLVNLYGYAEPRSPVLDPAAWQVQVQLDRVGLPVTLMASPLGPGQDVLVTEVFDRANPDLAAATLPEMLWYLEVNAPLAWDRIRRRLDEDPWLSVALAEQGADWFDWPEPPAAIDGSESADLAGEVLASEATAAPEPSADGTEAPPPHPDDLLLEEAQRSLGVMFELATSVGPPDPERLAGVRRDLLMAMERLDYGRRARAAGLVHLAGLVDGLYRQQYLHFTESLLAITARLQDEALFYPEQTRAFAGWLAEVLPGLSASYGRAFSTVDPQLNSVIATAFDIARALSRDVAPEDLELLRVQIADAVAGLALLIPDLGYYFDQPIRDPIAGGVDACTGIAGQVDADGTPAMTRELFDDCQEQLVTLANFEAREAQLAGNPNGPFGPTQLQRELGLTAGQRINYGIGYLHDRYETGCELPNRRLPNPLEWAYLATFMAWFAEQSPVYFQAPDNEARLERMRAIGQELVREIAEQVDCLAGAGAVLNDPVDRVTTDYRANLRQLGRALDSARSAYRSERLAPGADVRLDEDGGQSTAYRPAELPIGPCDPTAACEMTGVLSSTRALTGLFEDPYLLADQTGLGEVEICYDNMGWVDRRMEPVRPGDENVANFFGRLAFDLKGRYRDEEGETELFAFRFAAPEESHYLFSAQDQAVLDDACPVEWIGSRIVTGLPEGRVRLVPDRLTYLSAARTLPSRLLETNWDQGAEWRDWFVTGLGVERLPVPEAPDLGPRLNQHLQALYRAEQGAMYGALLTTGDGPMELADELDRVSTSKQLLRMQMMLFFPHILIHSDRLRESVAGQNGLLDRRMVTRGRLDDRALDGLMTSAYDRADGFREEWRALPETVRRRGSIADSVSHAMVRLNAIHAQFFGSAPAVTALAPVRAPVEVAPLAGGQGEEEEVGAAQEEL